MWHRATLETSREGLFAEVERLKQRLGSQSESIWKMSRADLEEVARKEIGVTQAELNKETVTTLRERIRLNRAMLKTATDPLASLPKGLSKMLSEALREEIQLRGLPEWPNATRAQMEILVRDDVAARITLSNRATSSTTDDDFEMVPERRAKAKAKAKVTILT